MDENTMTINQCQKMKGTSLVPGHAHAEPEIELTNIDNMFNSGEWNRKRTQRELILWAERNDGIAMLEVLFKTLG